MKLGLRGDLALKLKNTRKSKSNKLNVWQLTFIPRSPQFTVWIFDVWPSVDCCKFTRLVAKLWFTGNSNNSISSYGQFRRFRCM